MAKTNKTERIGVRLTPEERYALETLAASKGLSLSSYIREVVNNFIEEEEK